MTRRERERSVLAEYERLAPSYDERWAGYIVASVEATLRRLPPLDPKHILDVGCGTGAMLAALAARFPNAALHGVDPSRAMLAVAKSQLPAHTALVTGSAEALPYRDRCFDLVVSTSALHFFVDPQAAAREMNRVSDAGGTVVVTDWCDDFVTMKLFDRTMRLFGKANFTTFGTRACTALLHEAGFERVDVERYRIGPFWGLMTARGRTPAR